jgi:lysyl-tRNA synthetase class 2
MAHKDQNQLELVEHTSQEHEVRVEKVKELRHLGIEPWPAMEEISSTTENVIKQFETEAEKQVYTLAGRLMGVREHGKTIFATMQDQTGKLQLYFKLADLGQEVFDLLQKFIDIGDIIWVKGTSFRTKMGEITLHVSELKLLSKCLNPLPEKFHGIADIEIKYRQRYLDLITDSESRDKFIKRSKIVKEIRTFLDSHGYLEVETPMLHPIAGGAAARPFVTHHNAFDSDFYLRIAPELYLKRLLVGGLERVYEINRNFRNEGVSTRHNPEFTMLEFYTAHKDYHFIMNFVESMLRHVAEIVCGSAIVTFGDHQINLKDSFDRLSIYDAVKKYGGFTDKELDEQVIDELLKKHALKINGTTPSYGQKVYALFEEFVERKLIQPTFIIDFPIEVSPLAKRDADNPTIAARFELFIAGMELSNAFNELNDPFDQADRFRQQLDAHRAGDDEAHQYDADYVHALEYGLPPAVGVGIGIDRLTMILTNTVSIKDVILFPTLKKK